MDEQRGPVLDPIDSVLSAGGGITGGKLRSFWLGENDRIWGVNSPADEAKLKPHVDQLHKSARKLGEELPAAQQQAAQALQREFGSELALMDRDRLLQAHLDGFLTPKQSAAALRWNSIQTEFDAITRIDKTVRHRDWITDLSTLTRDPRHATFQEIMDNRNSARYKIPNASTIEWAKEGKLGEAYKELDEAINKVKAEADDLISANNQRHKQIRTGFWREMIGLGAAITANGVIDNLYFKKTVAEEGGMVSQLRTPAIDSMAAVAIMSTPLHPGLKAASMVGIHTLARMWDVSSAELAERERKEWFRQMDERHRLIREETERQESQGSR